MNVNLEEIRKFAEKVIGDDSIQVYVGESDPLENGVRLVLKKKGYGSIEGCINNLEERSEDEFADWIRLGKQALEEELLKGDTNKRSRNKPAQ